MELEIKYGISAELFSSILKDPTVSPHLSDVQTLPFNAVYYDTADGALSRLRVALRHRREGDKCTCTLKFDSTRHGDATLREEYEVEAPDLQTGIEKLVLEYNLPKNILYVVKSPTLLPISTMDFSRTVTYYDNDGEKYMISFDLGNVCDARQSVAISEMEIELIRGDASHMLAWADKIKQKYSLLPNFVSKLQKLINLH